MIKNYNEKLKYLRKKQGNICPICQKPFKNFEKIDLHHAKFHDTARYRETMPEFLDSVFNLVAVHNQCHLQNGNFGKLDVNNQCHLQNGNFGKLDLCEEEKFYALEKIVRAIYVLGDIEAIDNDLILDIIFTLEQRKTISH